MNLKDKKIALVSFANQPGGVLVHTRNIVANLNGQGLSFKVLLCSKVSDEIKDGICSGGAFDPNDVIVIPHAQKVFFFPFIAHLTEIFRREQFDIVDAFDDQTQMLAGVAAWMAGIKVFLCHNEGRFSPSTVSLPKRILYRAINFLLNRYFTRTIANSHGTAQELIKEGIRPSHKIEVLHLGIRPLHEGNPGDLKYSGLMTGAPVIGTLSRLSIEKGLDRFVKAAVIVLKEIPSARFVICGEGPQEQSLKALTKELRIDDRVEFRPFRSIADIKNVLQTYDIYAFPSLREGLGLTLLEAMSMGRPAVASDIDGVRDVINNGDDGILVDTADTKAFAQEIIRLCSDVPRAVGMGHRGLEKVRSFFNIKGEMRRLREIYFEVLGN